MIQFRLPAQSVITKFIGGHVNPKMQALSLATILSIFFYSIEKISKEINISSGNNLHLNSVLGSSIEESNIKYNLFSYEPETAIGKAKSELPIVLGEICGNLIDDDGDGLIDANDPDCIGTGPCGCPPGGTSYGSIAYGHVVPAGQIHCLTGDVSLSGAWNNIILNGSLYIINGAHLDIDGGKQFGNDANLVICEGASYTHSETSNNYPNNIYNYGWLQICGTVTTVDTIITGENSLTALKGNGLTFEHLEYVGAPSGNTYFMMDIATSLNSSSGVICLPGGTSEMIVEVDAASVTPSCVTDCNGCSELSSITTTCNDGSVETAYLALQAPPLEICLNAVDDNGDGRIDESFPGGIQSDMQLWLKAETGTNTTTNGSDITSWADQSVNGYSADADVNSTDDPTYATNAINFNPGIEFDGTFTDSYSDGLHLGADYIFAEKAGLHVFVVCDPDIDTGTDKHIFDFGLAANGGYGMIYSNNDYGMYTNNSFGGTNTELIHSDGEEPALVEFKVDFDDAQEFYRNGTQLASIPVTITDLDVNKVNEAAVYGALPSTTGPVSIGRKSASVYLDLNGGRIFDGKISEVIVFTDTLSSVDLEKVNSYLAIKYGITLNHDYMSSSGSIKKDVSDGYANTIAGIGRDDCSGFHQKQSKSVDPEAIVTIGQGSIAASNGLNAGTVGSDGTYLMWGNDGMTANASWNSSNINIAAGDFSRIDRVWSFTETFDVTDIALQLEVGNPNFDLPAMPSSANGIYYLFEDDDGDFTNGGTTALPMSFVSGDVWEVLLSDPGNGYFSFGIKGCGAAAPVLSKK